MKLLELLNTRANQKSTRAQERSLIHNLIAKANEIIEKTSEHLIGVARVFGEYDKHNAQHSERVLGYIEDLLGDKAKKLSSYDLFSIIAVSYLHDCGMAVSDREITVLKMVEKDLDGKKLLETTEAKARIRKNLDIIYGNDPLHFNGEIQNWLFKPANEDALIDYLSELLIKYQDYRNGRIDEIKKTNNLIEKNNEIRTDYLRDTHHLRIEKYVKNWQVTVFKDCPETGMGKRLATNIAKCCRAHGEDVKYIKDLPDNEQYRDGGRSNLQFIAMMLRLGDIIHFSYDRAHPALRSLQNFQSKKSLGHWHIKSDNELNYIVDNGEVSCSANCIVPSDYYKIYNYTDGIDHELALYNTLSSKWDENFQKIKIKEKVNRKNIHHDESFQPVLGLKFSLDQNKVLDLLMGAKLYTNEYACLRELYQNSLDACRCQIAIAKRKDCNMNPKGRIEFGLGEERRNGISRNYVYCLDNGTGMNKEIIQKFLLHVGSSYYRSSEFFKKQAETGAKFTPTSQFGIGMLSCFMIGDEIEITTREESSDVVSCVIEGPNEYFYYKTPTQEDAEKVPYSGTLVKVFLNDDYKSLLNDDPLENFASLLWYNGYDVPDTDDDRWFHHLYNIINDFILIVPEGISVMVSLHDHKELIKIYNKPLPITKELQQYAQLNYGAIEDYYQFEHLKDGNYLDIQVTDNDLIQDKDKSLECRMIIEVEKEVYGGNIRINGGGRCCVDGIAINDLSNSNNSLLYRLMNMGALNFIGTSKPQLSVNRDDIINLSIEKYEQKSRDLLEALIKKSINEVCAYIKEKKIPSYKPLYNEIWYRLLRKFEFFTALFYKCLRDVEICHDMIMPFQGIKMTFGDFIQTNETALARKEMRYEVKYSIMQLLLLRLLDSKNIEFSTENELVMIGHKGLPEFIPDVKRLDVYDYYFCLSQHDAFWSEYDIVQFAKFRFISNELKNRILNDDEVGRYYHSDNYIYLNKGFVKKLKTDRKNRRFRKYEETDISQKPTIIFVDNCGLYKIGNFIYDIIGDLIFYLMSKQEVAHSINQIGVRYSGLTLHVHNKSVLLLLEMNRDHKNRKICFAKRGKCTRQELLNSIPKDWKERIQNVMFVDGSVLSPDPKDHLDT